MAFTFNGNKPENNKPTTPTPPTSPNGIQYNGAITQEQFNSALQSISKRFGVPIQPNMINQQLYNQICQQYGNVQQNPNALQQLQQQAQQIQNKAPFNNNK